MRGPHLGRTASSPFWTTLHQVPAMPSHRHFANLAVLAALATPIAACSDKDITSSAAKLSPRPRRTRDGELLGVPMRILARAILCLAAALPLCLIAPRAVAQGTSRDTPTIAVGTRVRVTHPGEGRRVGTVLAFTSDSLTVRWDAADAASTLPLARVTRVEVSRGRLSRKRRGAGRGFLVGASAGALLGLTMYEKPACARDAIDGWCQDFGRVGGAVGSGLLIGGVGAAVGAIVGSRQRDRWQEVTLDAKRARVGLFTPSSRERTIGLAAAISF